VFIDKRDLKVIGRSRCDGKLGSFPIREVTLKLITARRGMATPISCSGAAGVAVERRPAFSSKNNIEFRMYRKFGADTTIKFDTPAPAAGRKS